MYKVFISTPASGSSLFCEVKDLVQAVNLALALYQSCSIPGSFIRVTEPNSELIVCHFDKH